MCGICGIIRFDEGPVEERLLRTMVDAMRTRGPDDEGYFAEGAAGFGHNRLSIIDLDTGRQPLFNERRTAVVVFNGEIYNFARLRKELEERGHVFATVSDTEVIVHAYEEFGEACVERLRGMFSFALWDRERRSLFIARDRLGKKPLYYYTDDRCFVFASEVKSIFASGLVRPAVDERRIDEYLSLGYVCAPDTLFKGIRKLPPASFLTVRDRQIRVGEYWRLELPDARSARSAHRASRVVRSEDEYSTRLENLLEESVAYRMISDVPLGAFLSGGIDSSVIVGLMSRLSTGPVKTFSVGYRNGGGSDELAFARLAAAHFGTEHHEIVLDPVDFYEALPRMVWHADEPIGDQACVPLWLLAREARRHATVLLSGEGSDELFAGYPLYGLMNGITGYQRIPAWVRGRITDPLLPRIFGERRGTKYAEWSRLPLEERFLGDMADLPASLKTKLYADDLLGCAQSFPVSRRLWPHYERVRGADDLDRMQYIDIKTWLVDDLLVKADKMTMAASVELRCPFLDHVLVEFAMGLPPEMRLRGLTTKYLLRKTFAKMLPPGTVRRPKKGFPVPLAAWFSGDLNAALKDVLLDRRSLGRGYFKRSFVEELIRRNRGGDYSKLLWSLLILEFWHRVFIDGRMPDERYTA